MGAQTGTQDRKMLLGRGGAPLVAESECGRLPERTTSKACRIAVFLIIRTVLASSTLAVITTVCESAPSPSQFSSTSLLVLLPFFHLYCRRLPFAHSPVPHAWEGHIPLGRVTSYTTTCLGSGGWIPTAGFWGLDSHSWCLGGGFPFSLLPGKAISPWEGSQATPKPKTCLGRPYPPGKGDQPQNHMPGVWGVDSHCWGLGVGFPFLVLEEDSRGPSFFATTSFWLFQALFRRLGFFLAWLPASSYLASGLTLTIGIWSLT